MTNPPSPLEYDVRGATCEVLRRAEFVRVDDNAIVAWADAVEPSDIRPVAYPAELAFEGKPAETVRWVLLLDALNFCFWTESDTPWTVTYKGRDWRRYLALRASLCRGVEADRTWLEPARWADASADELADLFAGQGRIPMFEDRVRIVRETGRAVLSAYEGEPLNIVEEAGGDAVALAERLAHSFEAFRDVHEYRGLLVPILKRAQIFAADLAQTWRSGGGPSVANLESLTAFADYRIPQVLRHLGILVLDGDLARRIEAGELIAPSSDEEIELRAGSIQAVERMAAILLDHRGIRMPAWIIDEHLWDRAHQCTMTVAHHRTLTCYY